ncbi:MAG: efflux RND transporter periplasmic adaptor subunit [Desulfobacteraceae bacterium]|nr:efflux RND transporter periplasmic adaptor subunit [Desulfobacteraceae bacterium]
MKRKTLSLSVLTVLIIAAALSTGCSKKKKTAAAPPPPEVEVATVVQKDVPINREWVATLDGSVNATILAQVQGYLIKQNYKEGDFVKTGAPLFEIDPRPFQAALDEAKGALAKQKAVLQTAKATLARIEPLAKANAVSQKDKDDAIGRVQAAEAQEVQAQAAVKKAEFDLGFTQITSPIDGIAGAATAQIGDLVGTPQAKTLTTVSTVDPIKVYIPISEKEYLQAVERAKQREATGAGERPTFTLLLADGSAWPQPGEFAFADRQVDPQTGTLKVAILFPNPGNVLRPGQYAKVRAQIGIEKDALLVPQRAVGELQGNYQVAVVDADNTVHIRNVKMGERSGDLWVVKEGLVPGDRVVAEGIQKVGDGVKVMPKAAPAPPEPAPQQPPAAQQPAASPESAPPQPVSQEPAQQPPASPEPASQAK